MRDTICQVVLKACLEVLPARFRLYLGCRALGGFRGLRLRFLGFGFRGLRGSRVVCVEGFAACMANTASQGSILGVHYTRPDWEKRSVTVRKH